MKMLCLCQVHLSDHFTDFDEVWHRSDEGHSKSCWANLILGHIGSGSLLVPALHEAGIENFIKLLLIHNIGT